MAKRYPKQPGAKGLTSATFGTSEDAASAMSGHRKRLHSLAIHTLALHGALAPFEAVKLSGVKACALQPRFSELIAEGMAEPTGQRRRNPETGKSAAVLRLTELGRERMAGGAQ